MRKRDYRHDELRRARERRGLAVIDMASLLGSSKMTVYRLESGDSASFDLVRRACGILDLDLREIIIARSSEYQSKAEIDAVIKAALGLDDERKKA